MEFDPVSTHKANSGWTAEKQGYFLRHLAATGSVTQAAEFVGMSVRSVYYLRNRADAESFRLAWRAALNLAADALLGLAYERAINGSMQKYYQDGRLIGERLVPSDRLLTWLLAHLRKGALPSVTMRNTGVDKPHPSSDLLNQIRTLTNVPPTPLDLQEEAEREAATPEAPRPAEPFADPVVYPGSNPIAQLPAPHAPRRRQPRARNLAHPHESA